MLSQLQKRMKTSDSMEGQCGRELSASTAYVVEEVSGSSTVDRKVSREEKSAVRPIFPKERPKLRRLEKKQCHHFKVF